MWLFLATTEVPSVPIYLLADDRCHSQLNKYSEEPLSGGFSQTRTNDLFTHNRCPYRHWCPRRTKCCLLKALHSLVHQNHLGLRVSSAIVTSLQQTNDHENLDLRFIIFISQQRSGIPEGRFCQISGHMLSIKTKIHSQFFDGGSASNYFVY